jgi:cytoskeletal protein RodZ
MLPKKQFAAGDSVRNSFQGKNKEKQMKSRKIFGVVFGSLAVLALSLPVWSQDTTQYTITTAQTPSAPETKTTQTTKEKTKYKHHHKKETKETQKTKTTTKPSPDQQTQSTTTTTTTPQ